MSLKAIVLNGTLKKSPETSHTEALINKVAGLMEVEEMPVRLGGLRKHQRQGARN